MLARQCIEAIRCKRYRWFCGHLLFHLRYNHRNVRVRFAPSPTGMLHLGGLRTALYNYLFARSKGGKFILRIEDTDQSRLVPGAMEKLIQMLQWAGIQIDEGPGIGGLYGPYVQSERCDLYKEKVQHLLKEKSAYHCFCTPRRLDLLRKDALRRREVPKYDNRCRHLTDQEIEEKLAGNIPSVVRFKLSSETEVWEDLIYGPLSHKLSEIEGDPVILKSDGLPTYHLANVVDDHYMEISHVLRGVEWQVSTPKHLMMYAAFGWEPPKFAHLPLIMNKDGTKLSKRQNDIHVQHFKDKGYFPGAVLNLLTIMGSGFKVRDTSGLLMEELVQNFDFSKLNTNSTRLDMERIGELNRLHLKYYIEAGDTKRLVKDIKHMVIDHYKNRVLSTDTLTDEYIESVLEWGIDRIETLNDFIQPQFDYIWVEPDYNLRHKDMDLPIKEALQVTVSSLEEVGLSEDLPKLLKSISKQQKFKYSQYMKLLRYALSGLEEGPSVAEMMKVLGKNACLSRLKHVLELCDT